jgi:hypothetical protein
LKKHLHIKSPYRWRDVPNIISQPVPSNQIYDKCEDLIACRINESQEKSAQLEYQKRSDLLLVQNNMVTHPNYSA